MEDDELAFAVGDQVTYNDEVGTPRKGRILASTDYFEHAIVDERDGRVHWVHNLDVTKGW